MTTFILKHPINLRTLTLLCLFAAAGLLCATGAQAATCTSVAAGGNWSNDATWTGCGSGHYPGESGVTTDDVIIAGTSSDTTVTLDVDGLTVASINFDVSGTDSGITHSGSNSITVTGTVSFDGQGTGNGDNITWNINAGSATVDGLISMAQTQTSSARTSEINITSGILYANGGITFNGTDTDTKKLVATSGSVYLKGALTATGCLWTIRRLYWVDTSAQTVTFCNDATSSVAEIYFGNSAGATLGEAITTTNVTSTVQVDSGTLKNGGYSITGNTGGFFYIANGATFEMTGSSSYPTGFTNNNPQPTSTVQYHQNTATTISAQYYGHLELKPAANSVTFTFVGDTTVAGTLTTGMTGAVSGGIIEGETYNPAITASALTAGPNATFKTGMGTVTLTGTGTPFTGFGGFTATAGNTFVYTGDGATARYATYYNLELKPSGSTDQVLQNGIYTVNNNLTIGDGTHAGGATGAATNPQFSIYGVLTVAANATLTTGGGQYQIRGTGTPVVVNGTLAASTNNTFIYFADSTHVVPTNFYNLTLTGNNIVLDAGTFNFAGTLSVNGSGTDTSNNPTVNAEILNVGGAGAYSTGTGPLTLTGTGTPLVVSGTFTATSGGKVVYTGSGATIKPTTYYNLDLKPSGASPIDLGSGTTTVSNNLVIGDGTNAGATGATSNSDLSVAGTLTVAANATYTTGSGTITLSGTGTPFTKTGTLTASTNNTLNYTGNGATSTAAPYYNLGLKPSSSSANIMGSGTYTVNGTLTIGDGTAGHAGATALANDPTINVPGNMTISANATFTASDASTLTIGGNFTKTGTFTHSNGTVAFNDNTKTSTLSYANATTFYNLSVTTAGKSIKLDNVDQTNVAGTLTLTGSDCTTGRVFLASDSAGVQAELNATGTKSVSYTDVRDINAIAAITTTSSTADNDNNTNWTITGCSGGGGGGGGNVFNNSVWNNATFK